MVDLYSHDVLLSCFHHPVKLFYLIVFHECRLLCFLSSDRTQRIIAVSAVLPSPMSLALMKPVKARGNNTASSWSIMSAFWNSRSSGYLGWVLRTSRAC